MRSVARAWNLFLIGRKPGSEDQLTEMLVWLANGVPEVAAALARLAFGDRSSEFETFELTTQHGIVEGRLDALMTSSQVALVVESKLRSTYRDDQIRRYLEWLETEFAGRRYRGLLTLTAMEDPLSEDDLAFAAEAKIEIAERRWADLHKLLEPLTYAAAAEGGLAPQLVREFLEMLTDEGLVPVEPLRESELGTAWADSWDIIRRYRDFFVACRERIGESLGADPIGQSKYGPGNVFWQDYRFDDGAQLAVSIYYTDGSTVAHRQCSSKRSSTTPRIGWRRWRRTRRKDGQPPSAAGVANARTSSRPLTPLLSAPTFEEQRKAIASAAAIGRSWIDTALTKEERLRDPRNRSSASQRARAAGASPGTRGRSRSPRRAAPRRARRKRTRAIGCPRLRVGPDTNLRARAGVRASTRPTRRDRIPPSRGTRAADPSDVQGRSEPSRKVIPSSTFGEVSAPGSLRVVRAVVGVCGRCCAERRTHK